MSASRQEIPAIFGQQIKRERERRGWNIRDLSAKSGTSINSISRAERGHDLMLSNAIAITAALGLSLSVLLDDRECARCDGEPPAWFICVACGQGGAA